MAYPLDCGDDLLDPHYCEDGCDLQEEHARIQYGAWIHKSVYPLINADPSNEAVWLAQIAAGKVILLPLLTGTFDGGSPVYVTGFGPQKQRLSGFDFKATIKDPVYAKNWAHYKSLVGKSSWHFAYGIETQIHITGKPVTSTPKAPITDNLDDLVVWETEIAWTEGFTPAPHNSPDVFSCSNPEVAPAIIKQPTSQSLSVGSPISLSVVATGTQPLHYQWKKDGVNIPGATNASYIKTNAGTGDGGTFTVVVSNAIGTVTSIPASVSVADITFDTILTFATATTDTAESVSGTVATKDPDTQFQFNKDTAITGLPNSMTITIGGVEAIVVDFPADYLGHPFRYIHSDAVSHMGTFVNGTATL